MSSSRSLPLLRFSSSNPKPPKSEPQEYSKPHELILSPIEQELPHTPSLAAILRSGTTFSTTIPPPGPITTQPRPSSNSFKSSTKKKDNNVGDTLVAGKPKIFSTSSSVDGITSPGSSGPTHNLLTGGGVFIGGVSYPTPQEESTTEVVISDFSTCTLQLGGGKTSSASSGAATTTGVVTGGAGKPGVEGKSSISAGTSATTDNTSSSTITYTVHFNREKTKRTTTHTQRKGGGGVNHSGGHGSTSSVNGGNSDSSGGGIIVLGNNHSSEAMTMGKSNTMLTSPISHVSSSGLGGGGAGVVGVDGKEVRTTSTKPCCFCWCCCCTCSWIRRRCLSVKAPNGSVDGGSDFIKDEELGSISGAEVKSWAESFEKVMGSEKGRKVFRAFLRCEYSEENILFWLACEDLKQERSPELIEEKARIIYEDYVSILSPREVSLDSRVREIINRNMIAPSQHTFDEAQLQIYTLMHRDSYPRFVNSTTYRDLLRTCGVTLDEPLPKPAGGAGGPPAGSESNAGSAANANNT